MSNRLFQNNLLSTQQLPNHETVFQNLQTRMFAVLCLLFLTAAFSFNASAQTIVTPSNPQGWATADTRPGGAMNFIYDTTAPAGVGALQLTTDNTNTAKVDYFHPAPTGTLLSNVTELSYYTKQNSGSPAASDASFQLPVFLCGGTSGFTTLVYEPYQKNGSGSTPPIPNVFELQDVDQGVFYSSRSVTCGSNSVVAGGGGAPFYQFTDLRNNFPSAAVIAFGVNIGSGNPNYNVEVDSVSFNGTSYNFEPDTLVLCYVSF